MPPGHEWQEFLPFLFWKLPGRHDLQELALLSIVGHGEGAIVLMATLCEECRQAAYRERRASEAETLELESALLGLTHVVLIHPHAHPARSYMPLLREYVPEIVTLGFPSIGYNSIHKLWR